MCTDEQAAQASLCAHAQQKNVQETALLGIEHQSVAIDHRLGFLTAVTDPLLHRNGGKDVNSLGWPLRCFGALRKRCHPGGLAGERKSGPSAPTAPLREQRWVKSGILSPSPSSPHRDSALLWSAEQEPHLNFLQNSNSAL